MWQIIRGERVKICAKGRKMGGKTMHVDKQVEK
jgi:hypothetical protein